MYKRSTMVVNKTGLHARPASDFVAEAKKYKSRITITNLTDYPDEPGDAKSIIEILSLAMAPETMVELCAEGADENEAVDAVPFPVSWTVKMKKKQKETQDILSYHTQAAGCSDKARAKASGGRQPIEECGRTGL